uniref:Serine/threonine-protein kinase receptor n=1 Tax=Acrobeloides nanus TaxID=290746 RepID=A0A914C5J5_9BILA
MLAVDFSHKKYPYRENRLNKFKHDYVDPWQEEDKSLNIPEDAVGRPTHGPLYNKHSSDLTNKTLLNLCYCSYGPDHCDYDKTCVKDDWAACFHAMQEVYNEETRRQETWHRYGCAPLERGSDASWLTCNAWRTPHASLKSIACCYEGNYCNLNITPPAYINENEIKDGESDKLNERSWLAFIIIGICILVGILILLTIWIIYTKFLKRKLPFVKKTSTFSNDTFDISLLHEDKKPLCSETSSGSGSGGASLTQRTIALDLKILGLVAKGRYGEVHKAEYRGSYVAVKTFYTTEEESWKNERDIYQTQMLNHANILQFKAVDISSNVDSMTQMMLVTDYHEYGSLYDYLRRREPLGLKEALDLAFSTISGIEHLHTRVYGTGSNCKPEIAHRDLKSKNVIVKRPGVCCIADFGLAVRLENGKIIPEKVNIQVGTKRYMAPELLNKTLNVHNFEEFKMADIYSFSLVLWEIVRRIQEPYELEKSQIDSGHRRLISYSTSSGIGTGSDRTMPSINSQSGSFQYPNPPIGLILQDAKGERVEKSDDRSIEARPYNLPYEGLVESDPSFEQMNAVVCIEKHRPTIEGEWRNGNNPVIRDLCNIMEECWSENAKSRHTSLKIKKELNKLLTSSQRITSVLDIYKQDSPVRIITNESYKGSDEGYKGSDPI